MTDKEIGMATILYPEPTEVDMQTEYVDSCVIVSMDIELDDVLTGILLDLEDYCYIVFTSSKPYSNYAEVRGGLINEGFLDPILLMRDAEDYRKDAVVKEEIYENCIKGKWNVHLVFDDRDQVVKMWRSKGLTCYQVANGGF